jgi:RNA polymerase sigma-70 factor (ECF subfamily)
MDTTLRDRAVDQAYREHASDVYRVAFGVLRDPDEALDATHDAFARAWERWEQYDSQRPLRAWLHGIVVHVALDQLRRRRVRRLAVPTLGSHAVTQLGGFGADPASDVARRQVVDDALGTLRPQARAVLVLRHYYGYDYAQIGAFLGINSGTVGSTLSRAHAELRGRLGADEAHDTTRETAAATGAATAARPTDQRPPEVLP